MQIILQGFGDPHVMMVSRKNFLTMYPDVENKDYSSNKDVQKDLKEILNQETAKAYGISESELIAQCKRTEITGYKFTDGENIITGDIVPQKIAYLEVKAMRARTIGREEDRKEEKKLFDFLRKIKKYNALVVDLRRNPGGNPNYWSKFLLPSILGDTNFKQTTYYFIRDKKYENKISGDISFSREVNRENLIKLKSKIPALRAPKIFDEIENNFKAYMIWETILDKSEDPSLAFSGNIYFLVGDYTASASDAMARMVKLNHIGKIVGGKTAGEGVVFPRYVRLPNTNFIMRTLTASGLVEGLNLEDTIATIPDIKVRNSDYKINDNNGVLDFSKDRGIQKILDIEGY